MLKQTHRKYFLALALGAGAIALGSFFYERQSLTDDAIPLTERLNAGDSGVKSPSQQSIAKRVQASYRSESNENNVTKVPSVAELDAFKARLTAFESEIDSITQREVAQKRRRLKELTDNLAASYQVDSAAIRIITTPQGTLRSISMPDVIPSSSPLQDSQKLLESNRELFQLASNETVELEKFRIPADDGLGAIVFSRRFKGVKVNGNEIVVSVNSSGIRGIAGQFEQIEPSFDVSGTITEAELIASASNIEGFKGFVPETQSIEEQIIFSGGQPVHVFRIRIQTPISGPFSKSALAFVAPRSGEVVRVRPEFSQSQQSTRGRNLNGDMVDFSVTQEDQEFRLINRPNLAARPDSEELAVYWKYPKDGTAYYDLNSPEDLHRSESIQGPWKRSAVSAVQNTDLTFKYFLENHNRDGGVSADSILYVVTDGIGEDDADNAFFTNQGYMMLGSGELMFTNLAGALDVVAHEIAHGVNFQTSNLIYENESGALNESFSDLFGVMVDRDDWLLGEDVMRIGNFLRSMKNPRAGGQPAHYDQYVDSPNTEDGDWGGVHTNSGIPNRMFYLLAEGLTDEGLGQSIGKNKTEKIAYKTLTKPIGRDANFLLAASEMLLVAEQEYGQDSTESQAVIDAWFAVGVDIRPVGNDTPSDDDDGQEDDDSPVGERTSTYQLPIGDDLLVDLRPRDGVVYDPRDDVFDLYAVKACISTDCYGVDSGDSRQRARQELYVIETTRTGRLNDVPVNLTTPSVATQENGNAWVVYVATDGNIRYSFVSQYDYEPITLDFGREVANVSVSRDFTRLAFVFRESPDIYIYNFERSELTVKTVEGQSYSTSGGAENVRMVDSLAFSADGDQLVFDYQVCRPSLDADSDCDDVWSIGVFDLAKDKFDYPYPGQPSTIDLGFPRLSSIGGERIVFQIWDYSGCPDSGACDAIVGAIVQYDYFSQGTEEIYSTNLDLSDGEDLKFGWPNYYPGDVGITWTQEFPKVMFQALTEDFSVSSPAAFDDRWETENVAGLVHRNAFLGVFSAINVSPQSQQFGAVIRGKSKTRTLIVENTGNQELEITGVVASDGLEADLSNVRIPAGASEEFEITFNSQGLRYGEYSGSVEISSTADRGNGYVSVVALVDRDTDGDGIPNSRDRDDDNDGVPDNRDAFPLDESESVDTDRDGIGNNADTDDDGDGLSDENEIELGTNPLDSDSDGDTIYDGEELTLGLDPLDGECPSWYCLTNRGWLWERAKLLTDADRDGLNLGEELEQGTDPQVADSDGDGLSDGDEIAVGTDPGETDTDSDGLNDKRETVLGTNPLLLDTDGDGLNDGAEVSSYSTDPVVADSDGDGVTDGAEVTAGSNPLLVDSDGDGLSDGTEINDLGSDPTATDSDADGVADDVEVDIGTNLLASDSDDDGAMDGEEIEEGTNPINADDCPLYICGGSFVPRLLASITSIVSGTSGPDDLEVAYNKKITNVSASAGNDTIVLNDFTRLNAHSVVVDGGADTDELQIPDYGTNAFYLSKDGCYNVLDNANLGAGSNNGTIKYKSIESLSINGEDLRIYNNWKAVWNRGEKILYGLPLTTGQQRVTSCGNGYGLNFNVTSRFPGMSSSDDLRIYGTNDEDLIDRPSLHGLSRSTFAGKLYFRGGAGTDILTVAHKNGDDIRLGKGDDLFRPRISGEDASFEQASYTKLDGGPGWDTLGFEVFPGNSTEDKTLNWGGAINFEHLEGTDASERIVGNNNDNILKGGNGSDVILGGGGRDVIYPNWNNDNRSNEDAGIRNTITLGADGDFIYVLDYSPNLASVDRVTDFDPDEDKVWVIAVGGTPLDDWDWVQGTGANSDHTYFRARDEGSGPKYVQLILENVDANDLSLDNFTDDNLFDLPIGSSANKCSQECD